MMACWMGLLGLGRKCVLLENVLRQPWRFIYTLDLTMDALNIV